MQKATLIDDIPPELRLIKILRYASLRKIRDLISKNPSMNLHYPTFDLKTPLTTAVDRGDPQILSLLIEKIPTDLNLSTTQPCGRTILMYVSFYSNCPEILQVLLRKGADPGKTDIRGWNSLQHAIVGCRVENVRLLLDHGLPVDSRDLGERTPLMISVYLSNLDTLNLLIDRGADIEARDKIGFTALQLAILHYKRAAAIALIERGSDVSQTTPLSKTKLWNFAGKMSKSLPRICEEKQKIDPNTFESS